MAATANNPMNHDAPPPSLLRQAWNILRDRNRLENADGTITTKFGARIIPYRHEVKFYGGILTRPGWTSSTNAMEHLFQPRVSELAGQMEAAKPEGPDDHVTLDKETGKFYLKSTLDRDGAEKAVPLGQVDMAVEESLYDAAQQRAAMHVISGMIEANNASGSEEGTRSIRPSPPPPPQQKPAHKAEPEPESFPFPTVTPRGLKL